jgi:23S rRNA (cytosine1962-C5)-methyltransferase
VPLGQIAGRRPAGDILVQERGIRVAVRPWEGSDAGVFSDMRDVRAWLEPHWRGRSVLNTFSYTGMFSVAAALGGASSVHTVDLSEHYLDRAKHNFQLNALEAGQYTFVANDTFKALDTYRRKGETFDVVIADPPSHSHSGAGTWSVAKDLGRLVAACLRVLAPGGWLVVATNLGTMSPKEFRKMVLAGSHKAGRPLRLLHEGCPPLDYPASLDFPESRYLKCWVLQA